MDRLFVKDDTVYSAEESFLNETLFHNANGYLGVRGCLEEGNPAGSDTMRGMYINGFYDVIPMKQAESLHNFVEQKETMLNVCDTQTIAMFVDGEVFSPYDCRNGKILSGHRILDMNRGFSARDIVWQTSSGKEISIYIRRMTSFKELSLFTIEYNVTPLNCDCELEIRSTHVPEVRNFSKSDDPRLGSESVKLLEVEKTCIDKERSYAVSRTRTSRLSMCSAVSHRVKIEDGNTRRSVDESNNQLEYSVNDQNNQFEYSVNEHNNRFEYSVKCHVNKNQKCTLEKYTIITDSVRESDVEEAAKRKLDTAMNEGLAHYYTFQQKYLNNFWNQSLLEIEGDTQINKAAAYNMYQLLQAAARDSYCSIAAKGLSGEGYEGHYFWDTEMFVLPFFILTNPELAKQLLTYRYNTLDAAIENARLLGHKKGALYPWRTITGIECSGYFPSGTAQYHINGDIVYAVVSYYLTTGDEQFIVEKGARIVLETARLWLDVGNYNEGMFVINMVTGPDEYTCLVNNNYYTNSIAKYNLLWAVKFYELLKQTENGRTKLSELGININEISEMRAAADAMFLPYDSELGINPQDDSFLSKKVWKLEETSEEDFPLLLHYHPLHLYRYQVCKQADTVMAYFLFEDEQPVEVMKRSFEYYEKITTHDSSLSTCIFSIVAARLAMKLSAGNLGHSEDSLYLREKAIDYFGDSALMDIDNLHDNTMYGIHTANMGGCYMAIVYGFAGLRIDEDRISVAPFLPDKWSGYSFKLRYRDNLIKIRVSKDNVEVKLESGNGLKIKIYDKNEYNLLPFGKDCCIMELHQIH